MVYVGNRIEKNWHAMQDDVKDPNIAKRNYREILQDLKEKPLAPYFDPRRKNFLKWQARMEFLALRSEFICPDDAAEKDFLPADFDFAHYLAVCMGTSLAEIVELPAMLWLALEALALLFFVLMTVFDM
jgi:hypothetical protein